MVFHPPSAHLLGSLALILMASTSVSADTPAQIASSNSLNYSYTYPFPTSTVSSSSKTQSYMASNWNLIGGKVQAGGSDLSFVNDPFDSSSTSPVLQVTYAQGSYGGSGNGGAQFYSVPLNSTTGTPLQSMLLSYSVAFSSGFGYQLGGKLPGLRGGPATGGCSGGSETDGTSCFSTRLMWRQSGAGEVYAYIPTNGTSPSICTASNVICNSDYGTSLARGSFSFLSGQWNPISLYVQLNDPTIANGVVKLYYNNTLALSFTNLELRSSSSLSGGLGLFFSTFFGGSDATYGSPQNQTTYFKDFALYGGVQQATGSGGTIGAKSAASPATSVSSWIVGGAFIAWSLFMISVTA